MKATFSTLVFFFVLGCLIAQPAEFPAPCSNSSVGFYGMNNVKINGVAASSGDWIAAFDPRGNIAGRTQISNPAFVTLFIYGGTNAPCNTLGNPAPQGMLGGESFTLIVWDQSAGLFYTLAAPVSGWAAGGFFNNPFATSPNFNVPFIFLPVELLFFEAKIQDDRTSLLQWATATEINNSHFEIEHSADGRNFEYIGKVNGAGESQTLLQYTFTDESPAVGLNYYRLKQVDFDGQFEYSKVVSVSLDRKGGSDMEVFPNPAGTFAELLLPEGLSEVETTITVHDNAGREVLRRKEQPNVLVRLPLDGIPAGFYTLTVRGGNEVISKPLVVQ